MNYKNVWAKEMINAGEKVIYGASGNISPDIEWIKWLNYEPEFEKRRIEYLSSKNTTELSLQELEEISRYRKNKDMANLFKIYGTSECSKEEAKQVYEYMQNTSIEELMLNKLTADEICYAKQEILKLSEMPEEQLRTKVKEEQQRDKYAQLSMVDSYILHIISNIDYARDIKDLNKLVIALTKK